MRYSFMSKKIIFYYCLLVLVQTTINSRPLHDAVRKGDIEIIKQLLSRGFLGLGTPQANINERNIDGCTPLHIAVREGHKAIVRLLFEYDVVVDIQDNNGYEPLHIAAMKGRTIISQLLLEHNANKDAQNMKGSTPLHIAVWSGYDVIVQQLLDSGANINVQDKNGWTPLHNAAVAGHDMVVKQLLERGARIEALTMDGWTPLHNAAWKSHESIVRLLLTYGADPTPQTTESRKWKGITLPAGLSPADIARLNKHVGLSHLLLSAVAPYSLPVHEKDTSSVRLPGETRFKRSRSQGESSAMSLATTEHPDFRGYPKTPESIITSSQSRFIDNIIGAFKKDDAHRLYSLLENSTDLTMRNPENNTMVHLAIFHGAYACLSSLLEWLTCRGAGDVLLNAQNNDNMTAHDLTVYIGDETMAALLEKCMTLDKVRGKRRAE